MKKAILVFAFLFLILGTYYAQAKQLSINSEKGLLVALKSASLTNAFDIAVKKARPFEINPEILKSDRVAIGDSLMLNLFAGKEYLSVTQSKTTDVNGTTVLVAKLTEFQFAYCFISINKQNVLITIDIPERNEKYSTRFQPNNNTQYLLQLDEMNLDELHDLQIKPENLDSIRYSHLPEGCQNRTNQINTHILPKSVQQNLGVEDTAQIDLLVVYTPAAKEWADTFEGDIDNTIGVAISKGNLTLANSKLGVTLNLVHTVEVNYKETGSSFSDLENLTYGGIPNIHDIRDVVGADLVVLFTKIDDVGGLSNALWNKDGIEENGYVLVRVQQANGLTTIHEIGHALGAGHHKGQNYQAGPTDWCNTWPENTWSAGWRWQGDDENYYCTVMTYEAGYFYADGINHYAVPYFSDPEITYEGKPTGDVTDGNNALTIKMMKHIVASYRIKEEKQTPTIYTLAFDSINAEGAVSGGYVINEGISSVTDRGIVWATHRLPTFADHSRVFEPGSGEFRIKIQGLVIGQTYYARAYATNSAGIVYGNQVEIVYYGTQKRDFITRWKLPDDQDKLDMVLVSSGNVMYSWETVPPEESGTGLIPIVAGLVRFENLPKGKTIRVRLSPENLNQFTTMRTCYLPENPDHANLLDVEQWGSSQWTKMHGAFYKCAQLDISASDLPDLVLVEDMSYMFMGCAKFNGSENMNDWCVSNVTNMFGMFDGASIFNHDISNWDVSNVKNMGCMFSMANKFNQNIAGWDVSKVEMMWWMFSDAYFFDQDIGRWNVSNVTNMMGMLGVSGSSVGSSRFNHDISSWDVSNVTDMYAMFSGAVMFNQDISNWDISKVTNMGFMFNRARVFNQDISNWDVSNVTSMIATFQHASLFNQDISEWDVSKVIDMAGMFFRATSFNQSISKWSIAKSADLNRMLDYCGMDDFSYSSSLIGWSSNINIPDSIKLGARSLIYNNDARDARESLILKKGWVIEGDKLIVANGNMTINEAKIRVFPNPVINDLTMTSGNWSEKINYQIINEIGKTILTGSFINETTISTENLEPGVYFVKLQNEDVFEFKKVLKY